MFNGAKPCLTLDPRYKERGVLIQDNDGDWAIVVGSWFVTDDQPGIKHFDSSSLENLKIWPIESCMIPKALRSFTNI